VAGLCLRFGITVETICQQLSTETELVKTATDDSLPYRRVKRARAALLYELTGTVNVAEMIGCAVSTVRKWYHRYQEHGISGLNDLPRSGRPKVFSARFRLELVAIVCQKPPEVFLPGVTHWSIRDLVMMLPRLLNLKSISAETVRNILKEHHLKPHKLEYYLTKTDPDFFSKAKRILDIYQSPPADGVVISFDERTAIQVLERLYPGKPLKPGYPEKMEFHYKRHPTFSLLAGLSIQTGHVFGRCYRQHTQHQFLNFMHQLTELYGERKLYIILDNLSTHKTELVKNWLAEQNGRVEFIFTPFHGSWLNQIEIWFNILQGKCLRRMNCSSTEAGMTHVLDFLGTWNNYYARPFNWKFTTADLEQLLTQEPIKLPLEAAI